MYFEHRVSLPAFDSHLEDLAPLLEDTAYRDFDWLGIIGALFEDNLPFVQGAKESLMAMMTHARRCTTPIPAPQAGTLPALSLSLSLSLD
jgi:hypothetical protein